MSEQDQHIEGSQLHDSQVQLNQAGRDAVSFQNSDNNQVIINNALLQLGPLTAPSVDWDWAKRLLEKKQLPEIRKRLTDTLGRERALMAISFREQLSWVGRAPLEPDRVLQIEGQGEAPLDPRQLLIETFDRDDIKGKLLIVGPPGAGKTTALLSLAEQLVVGAIDQPETVIPVLFELSTWRKDNQSIRDWLIEQLYDQHGGNRRAKLYEQWLERQILLPLMDGLDELGFDRQKKCTQKLQEFAAQYPHLVVCCRTKEFTQVGIRLDRLNGAIRLEPLSDRQIRTFLAGQKSTLWSVLDSTPQLQKLLETTPEGNPGLLRIPLFVALAARVYDPQNPFATRADLLQQYVDWQLSQDVRISDRHHNRDYKNWAYSTLEQEPARLPTQETLAWIARQLQNANQVELLIEHIQPIWLETNPAKRQYRLIVGLVVGLISGLIFGLFFGLTGEFRRELIRGLVSGSIIGLIIVLISKRDEIQPVEGLRISMPHEVRREILNSVSGWLTITSLMAGLAGWLAGKVIFGLTFGLMVGLGIGLATGLLNGLKQDLKLSMRPNQGIWNSLQSTIWTAFFIYPIGVMLAFGSTALPRLIALNVANSTSSHVILSTIRQAFPTLLIPGIFAALLFSFLAGGGLACVQHVCLRWVLWRQGIAPWNLAQFLNYCVERRLLQRVGGSYRFIHRELLDHFAECVSRAN